MYRFHDFNKELGADFWRNYYGNPDLIDLFAYANNVVGAELSYTVMQHYDIREVFPHLPGVMEVWSKLELGEPTNVGGKYPYRYTIPEDILYIDTLHEKIVDPAEFYQVNVDFVFYKGRLDFGEEPKSKVLYAPKLSRIGTRLNDVFGKAFGYSRFDSYYYRDTMIPLMELMYKGPTYNLIKTAGNVMVGNPIAKYGGDVPVTATVRAYLRERKDADIRVGTVCIANGNVYEVVDNAYIKAEDLDESLSVDLHVKSRGVGRAMNVKAKTPALVNNEDVASAYFLTDSSDGGKGEVVVDVTDEWVQTDVYRYPHGAAIPSVKPGDKLARNQQLADVVELYTHKTHPEWWVGRAPELFYKYADTALDDTQKNLMMSRYLKSFVANLQVKFHRVDWTKFQFQRDVFDLILDGMPVRSDLILSGAYEVSEECIAPDEAALRTVPHNFCLWTNRSVPGAEGYIHPPTEFFPRIGEETWKIGTQRFFFIDEGHEFDEFWSSEPTQMPYVEPYICNLTCELKATSSYSALWKRIVDVDEDENIPLEINKGVVNGMKSILNDDIVFPVAQSTSALPIYASQMIEKILLSEWDMSGVHTGVDGLVCDVGSNGVATSQVFNMGAFPKRVSFDTYVDTPEGTSIDFEYMTNGVWAPFPATGIVNNVVGEMRIRATLYASEYLWPVLKGVGVNVQLESQGG